ncbi:MAG TPA: hypothetical protein VFZ27_17880 [Terriglobia bacterium]|nr:hypothetical protein [Terriglobia bacterium]
MKKFLNAGAACRAGGSSVSTRRNPQPQKTRAVLNEVGASFMGFGEQKTKKNTFFQKQTGEVAENKGSALKQTGTNRKTKRRSC